MAEGVSRPSEFFGFEDPVIAWDFDRVCNIRRKLADKAAADRLEAKMKGESHVEPESLFQSNELGKFGPTLEN